MQEEMNEKSEATSFETSFEKIDPAMLNVSNFDP